MSALYPDVPTTEGVPNVLRNDTNPGDGLAPPLSSDGSDLSADKTPAWGLYDEGGAQAIIPDSIVSFEHGKEEQISTFPVEKGGFQSYNKVETPYNIHLVMTKGGPIDERVAFLALCETLRASTDLYDVYTPEMHYENGNVTRTSQVRNATNGAQLLTVEMVIEEVRNSATSQFTASSTQSPTSADAADDGSVQPDAPTPAQTPTGQPL
jgi:hypothetical protein